MILDSPGAVITTSTRPDNLTATLRARERKGPVAVFDPQRLARGIPSATRWSPIRGCEDPHIAMVRAKALTADTASGTTDSNFWQSSAEQAVRCLLHAAALAGCSPTDLNSAVKRWFSPAWAEREPELRREVLDTMLGNDRNSYVACFRVFAEADAKLWKRSPQVSCPVLAITGSDDSGSTPEMAHDIADHVQHGGSIIVQGARHLLPLERRAELSRALAESFAEAPA